MNDLDERLRLRLAPAATDWRSVDSLRDAAVLAQLAQHDGEDHLLFTQRRPDLTQHGGEMSFPGGRREGDEHALACALRESHEEIGLAPERVTVLGRLPETQSRAGYRVACFVGRTPGLDGLVADPNEVAALVPIPLAALARDSAWQWRDWRRQNGVVVRIPYFPFGEHLLWGMTGLLVQALLRHVRSDSRGR